MVEKPTKLHWPGTGLFPLKIAGSHFYRADIARVARNEPGRNSLVFCSAMLIPETNNVHDVNAVLIQIASEKAGHLSREIALELRNRLATQGIAGQETTCDAVISAGLLTSERSYDYIVELDLDLSAVPTNVEPTYPVPDRRDTCLLEYQGDGRYQIDVWLEDGVLENMHKNRVIDTWTTEHWDTINYYVAHTKNCGIGHKLFSVPKKEHYHLFGNALPAAHFLSISGRRAVIELHQGRNNSRKPKPLRGSS